MKCRGVNAQRKGRGGMTTESIWDFQYRDINWELRSEDFFWESFNPFQIRSSTLSKTACLGVLKPQERSVWDLVGMKGTEICAQQGAQSVNRKCLFRVGNWLHWAVNGLYRPEELMRVNIEQRGPRLKLTHLRAGERGMRLAVRVDGARANER